MKMDTRQNEYRLMKMDTRQKEDMLMKMDIGQKGRQVNEAGLQTIKEANEDGHQTNKEKRLTNRGRQIQCN